MPSKRDYWSEKISGWSASGSTQAAWCAKHRLSISSVSYWLRKLAVSASAARALPRNVADPLQARTTGSAAATKTPTACCARKFKPNGAGLSNTRQEYLNNVADLMNARHG